MSENIIELDANGEFVLPTGFSAVDIPMLKLKEATRRDPGYDEDYVDAVLDAIAAYTYNLENEVKALRENGLEQSVNAEIHGEPDPSKYVRREKYEELRNLYNSLSQNSEDDGATAQIHSRIAELEHTIEDLESQIEKHECAQPVEQQVSAHSDSYAEDSLTVIKTTERVCKELKDKTERECRQAIDAAKLESENQLSQAAVEIEAIRTKAEQDMQSAREELNAIAAKRDSMVQAIKAQIENIEHAIGESNQ